jgi:hypothetical protein
MREHNLSIDSTDDAMRSIGFSYDNEDQKHLWLKAWNLRDDPDPDILISVMLDEESARAALMFIQSFLLDLSRAKQIKKYGDSAL